MNVHGTNDEGRQNRHCDQDGVTRFRIDVLFQHAMLHAVDQHCFSLLNVEGRGGKVRGFGRAVCVRIRCQRGVGSTTANAAGNFVTAKPSFSKRLAQGSFGSGRRVRLVFLGVSGTGIS